ncbi:hypothetical protein J7I91_09765 [Pseudomonas sp. ISL-84]|nr:hypothetical protein [Pseudomonas sp. ISL-84]
MIITEQAGCITIFSARPKAAAFGSRGYGDGLQDCCSETSRGRALSFGGDS